MGNKISFKNRDRLIQLGIAISTLRRIKGLSQDEFAYRANISRSHLSSIEAPGVAHSFSIDVFFSIADALDVDPAKLINASVFPDEITKK